MVTGVDSAYGTVPLVVLVGSMFGSLAAPACDCGESAEPDSSGASGASDVVVVESDRVAEDHREHDHAQRRVDEALDQDPLVARPHQYLTSEQQLRVPDQGTETRLMRWIARREVGGCQLPAGNPVRRRRCLLQTADGEPGGDRVQRSTSGSGGGYCRLRAVIDGSRPARSAWCPPS